MNCDPQDDGDHNDECRNQYVANHLEPPIRLWCRHPSTPVVHDEPDKLRFHPPSAFARAR